MSPVTSCTMVDQGFEMGSCLTSTPDGPKRACISTLRQRKGQHERLIASMHLSRPEDYFSIYQSGCNHNCLKCHSIDFSKIATGKWVSTSQLAEIVHKYSETVTVREPRERATMWHAGDLCRHCGVCVITGFPSDRCPDKLEPKQVVFSPQGFGPARNIAAFTGGDIACVPEYYAEATQKIKERCKNFWVLLETNGYGLTADNLEVLHNGGIDAFWLDIKAYNEDTYRHLCGATNKHMLSSIQQILDHHFVLEILALHIPEMVEVDQHIQIAQLIAEIDPTIPTTLLAFFPTYKLKQTRAPTLNEMMTSFAAMKYQGLKNLRLGNVGVFAKTHDDLQTLLDTFGDRALG